MTLTLTENIEATDRVIGVTGTVPDTIGQGYRFRLDDELCELTTFGRQEVQGPVSRQQDPDPNVWLVRRAVDGIAASHTAGATILGAIDAYVAAESGTTPPEPFASSTGGGGLPTGWTQDGGTGLVDTGGYDFTAWTVTANSLTLTTPLPAPGLGDVLNVSNDAGGNNIDNAGDISVGSIDASGAAGIDGDATIGGFADIGGDATIGGDFQHNGTAFGVFGLQSNQIALARPSGDAGDLWDILAAYGFVTAP